MISFFRKPSSVLSLFVSASLTLTFFAACEKPDDKNSSSKEEQAERLTGLSKKFEEHEVLTTGLSEKLSALNSATYCLLATDLDAFRPRRTKEDILKDLKWRGAYYTASEVDGKAVSAIVYEVLSDDPNCGGMWVWGIFIDNRFVKFVKPPPSLPEDKEVVNVDGNPRTRAKLLKAGDARFLIRGMNAKPVSISDLKKEVKSLTATPEHIDPGLTVVYLGFKAMGLSPAAGPPTTEKDYLRNAALRDQYNAARLSIGMTEAEVEAMLKAKPLESGTVDAGKYQIYGSNESFNINAWLHFSNILVIYRDGKAIAIESVPARDDWRRKLTESTIDLPKPPPGPEQK